jgi:hypothetical protein
MCGGRGWLSLVPCSARAAQIVWSEGGVGGLFENCTVDASIFVCFVE